MLRHDMESAVRNLTHNRLYSVINIAGLSIGLATAMLIRAGAMREPQIPHQAEIPCCH